MIGPSTDAKPANGVQQLKYVLLAMRPKQWVKNAFVFAGIIFAGEHLFTEAWALGHVLVAFGLFCLVSGCVYLDQRSGGYRKRSASSA